MRNTLRDFMSICSANIRYNTAAMAENTDNFHGAVVGEEQDGVLAHKGGAGVVVVCLKRIPNRVLQEHQLPARV